MNVQTLLSHLNKGGNNNGKEVVIVVDNKEYSVKQVFKGIDKVQLLAEPFIPVEEEEEDEPFLHRNEQGPVEDEEQEETEQEEAGEDE